MVLQKAATSFLTPNGMHVNSYNSPLASKAVYLHSESVILIW